MKGLLYFLILILTFGFMPGLGISDQPKAKKQHSFDCNLLADKAFIYQVAKSIIDQHDSPYIWNLSDPDSSEFFSTEDYFTNSKTKTRLVLIGGNAGMSAGSADNLLILFSCEDTFNILWSGQLGNITPTNIKDLNGDGIKEIICTSSMMYMGECNDSYSIFNFKDKEQNFLFQVHSRSIIDCGFDNAIEIHEPGDTLEVNFDCALLNRNNQNFSVRQVRMIKTHGGGKTYDEILKNIRVVSDTTIIKMK